MKSHFLKSAALFLSLAFCTATYGQKHTDAAARARAVKVSPAYCVLVLEKVKAEAEFYDFKQRYTATRPGYKGKAYTVIALQREMKRLRATPASRLSWLTESYAKLLLRKVQLESNLVDLQAKYTPDWPETKTTKYELAALRRELKDLLR